MKGLATLSAALLALAVGCSAAQETTDETRSEYAVTLNIHFADSIFNPPVAPRYTPKPFDEGFLFIFHPIRQSPAHWQFSQTVEPTKITNVSGKQIKAFGPVLVHPDSEVEISAKVSLPAYICAQLFVVNQQDAISKDCLDSIGAAISSTCMPAPKEYGELSFADTTELLPNRDSILPEAIDLDVDTAVNVDDLIPLIFFEGFEGQLCQLK